MKYLSGLNNTLISSESPLYKSNRLLKGIGIRNIGIRNIGIRNTDKRSIRKRDC
jgi:hypothetical protein